tara:strand:+ start:149 stop:961 length:813 start_codon:yes stop_codon:yes gene_type:complete
VKQSFKKDRMVLRTKDYVASNEHFNLFLDNKTNIVWTDVGENHNHNKYYENENYLPHNKKRDVFSFFYMLSQKIMFSYKLKVLHKILQPSSIILDYGSGDGHFAKFLKKKKINVQVYDPIISKQKSSQVIDNQNDVIMMWHVLEHVPDINKTIIRIEKILKHNGALVLAVPNRDSFDSKVYGKHWAAWDVPRHLYHFNHNSLENLMKEKGFSLISKHALWLDSYYVSYLSSKYQKSIFPWINALVIGSISNILALFTSRYSSSFYVFKRN